MLYKTDCIVIPNRSLEAHDTTGASLPRGLYFLTVCLAQKRKLLTTLDLLKIYLFNDDIDFFEILKSQP